MSKPIQDAKGDKSLSEHFARLEKVAQPLQYPAPPLSQKGLCSECYEWINLRGKPWLPNHKRPDGVKCHNSGYSPSEYRYVVRTNAEAQDLALYLQNTQERCRHSMGCGDGSRCHANHRRYAQALAFYVLGFR